EESAHIVLGDACKYKETEELSIKAFKLYQAEKYDKTIDIYKHTLEIGHLFETYGTAINRHNS
ncbi:MAG TPA: hypothetical protein PLL66_07350, partial [Bacteroidales bacterium]|nr:hypothetical protein [Bacteroidales bacterium]